MTPNTEASSPLPKRRRRRPARSCEQCRRRKVRCDQDQPCRGCVRARQPLQCSYRDNGSVERSGIPGDVRELATGEASSRSGGGTGTQSSLGTQRELVVGYPRSSGLASQPGERSPAAELERKSSHIPRVSSPLPSTSSAIPPVVPRLRNVPEKTKLFGQTHWLHTAEKFPVSGKFHPVEVEPSFNDAKAELIEALKDTRALRRQVRAQGAVKLEEPLRDLFATLPVKETCDELVRCYLRTFEPLYRIVHLPSFWREYNRIWEDPSASIPTVFLMKVSLILAMGTTFYASSDDTETALLCRLTQSWVQNAQWWLTGPSEKSTYNLDGLQVFCLLIIARQTTFNCPGASSWLSTASLLRMAITMGLHRNPNLFPTLSPFQREQRARLWATVLELCIQSCLDLALPLNLSLDDYDAPPPSNYNDADLELDSWGAPAPSGTFTDSSLQILLTKSLPLRIEIVRLLNDFRNQQSHENAIKTGTELRAACREVAAFFHSQKALHKDNDGSRLRPTDFHRKFMDIHLRRFTLFLHRNFMLHARTEPRFYLSRKLCVESAMVITSAGKDSDLSLPKRDLDDLSKLSLVGRGLFKCALSLDAILVLALEIITQLDDDAAPQYEADDLDEMAKATRAPLIQTLEHVHEQLLNLLASGNTSLKRLLFVVAYLNQIRAMESGGPIKQAIYEAVTEMLRKCVTVLREIRVGGTPQESVGTSESLITDLLPFDFDSGDTAMDWDLSNMLYFPALNEMGQSQWPN
ncbi:Fc.00g023730.m01.CDS01 [Cosmosporella sp. VM-42]